MACRICNLFQGKFPLEAPAEVKDRLGDRNHLCPRFTWRELEASALSGCHCCDILARGCRGCFRQHGIEPETDVAHGEVRLYYPPVLVPAAAAAEEEEEEEDGSMEEEEEGQGDADKTLFFYLKSGSTSSGHRGRFDVEMFAVDVGLSEDGSSQSVIRLVETEAGASRGRYLCLSHCWGAAQIIRTTKVNIEKHKEAGIAWGQLSRTFREAVEVARALGFRYILIDSLCIVQDDPADWAREAARMASVYSNGHLTIAATRSADGEGGGGSLPLPRTWR